MPLQQDQISCFLNPNWKRRNWSKNDIKQALLLWTISKKAYRYLRAKKILPLPCESVLLERTRHFKIPPGYLNAVDNLLQANAVGRPPVERVIQISLDEV